MLLILSNLSTGSKGKNKSRLSGDAYEDIEISRTTTLEVRMYITRA